MNDIALRRTLERATLEELRMVIDWLDRPWARHRNDLLRSAYHDTRRDPARKAALVFALVYELTTLDNVRDIPFVAHQAGIAATHTQLLVYEIIRRLAKREEPKWTVPPEVITTGLQIIAEVVRQGLTAPRVDAPTPPSKGHGRRHRGR